MPDADVIVVGGGIFGRTIAMRLFVHGRDVLLVDDGRPLSGSAPSACLMKPSWFSGLGRAIHDPALETLDELFGVRELEFKIRPSGKRAQVLWVPSDRILCRHGYREENATVLSIGIEPRPIVKVTQHMSDPAFLEANVVVVAAGVWCSELMEVKGLTGKQGVAFRWTGSQENIIDVWAPYKQLVLFQETEESIWGGDGAAIKPDNWTGDRELAALNRVMRAARCVGWPELGPPSSLTAVRGIRPYVPGVKPCLLEERAPGLWLATGGAKNGTLAAGWAASEIERRTR